MNLIRGEFFPQVCTKILVYDNKIYCDPNTIEDGDIVYLDTHHALSFKDILNQRKDLTIVTSNSDHCLYDGLTDNPNSIDVQQLTCWKRWFGQNSYSENVIPIPIGFENKKWETFLGPKTEFLHEVREKDCSPIGTVYLNCKRDTSFNPIASIEKRSTLRQNCYDIVEKMNFVTVDQPNLTYKQYLNRIKEHKFVLSPRGNGLDCHRTWEILMMKRVPVIKREGSLESIYKNMPVLFIDEWSDLNDIDFDKVYNEYFFDNQEYLEVDYWLSMI